MVRCFEDDNVIHVNNRVDPVDDSGVINFELALSDVGQIERRIERLGKKARIKEEQVAQDVRLRLALDTQLPPRPCRRLSPDWGWQALSHFCVSLDCWQPSPVCDNNSGPANTGEHPHQPQTWQQHCWQRRITGET